MKLKAMLSPAPVEPLLLFVAALPMLLFVAVLRVACSCSQSLSSLLKPEFTGSTEEDGNAKYKQDMPCLPAPGILKTLGPNGFVLSLKPRCFRERVVTGVVTMILLTDQVSCFCGHAGCHCHGSQCTPVSTELLVWLRLSPEYHKTTSFHDTGCNK